MRFHPAIENLKSLKNREFLSLRGVFGEFLPSLHKWENYKHRYEALNALGGGPLLTSHHEIDLAIYLIGNVDKVSCIFRNTSLDIDAPDHAILNLFHCNGAISNLDLNFYYRKYVRNFQIATTQDMINYEPFGNGLKIGSENYINYKDFDFNQTYVCLLYTSDAADES